MKMNEGVKLELLAFINSQLARRVTFTLRPIYQTILIVYVIVSYPQLLWTSWQRQNGSTEADFSATCYI